MATNPSSTLPEFIDNTWINQSPEDRLLSIEQLQKQGQAAQPTLLYIARNDEHTDVRCGATRYLTDVTALTELQGTDAAVADAASQQYHRILAGATDSTLSDAEKAQYIQSLPMAGAKQVALLTKSKTVGSAALERITAAEELADLGLFAASVHVRKNAVAKITDQKLLSEIFDKVRDSDKTLSKLLEQRLADNAKPDTEAKPEKPVVTNDNSSTEPKAVPTESAASTAESSTPASGAAETAATAPQPVTATDKPRKSKAEKTKPAPDPVTELPKLELQLAKLSHKHTEALNGLRNSLNRCRKAIAEDAADLLELAAKINSELTEKLTRNLAHQEHLQQTTTALLEQLQQALDAGQSHEALPTWDKIQGNISNTSGKIRAALQKLASVHKDKLTELRDWKTFAATEKKKELIAQMQHLLESKMHAADRSKHISKMHQEWKSLGRSNQNEQLWREFKKISDEAYKPCKEYFKQRKQLMASNFIKRREICELLEAELAKLEAEPENEIMVSGINKLLSEADKEWKAHAPIEQAKIKALQKRYYAALNQLRKIRKHSMRGNGEQKLEFIAQANALAEHEDNQHAMREAKRLQSEWKKIGPTSFKEDKKYWEDFRAACDKIFAKRNEAANAQRDSHKKTEGKLAELLTQMEALYNLDDEAFRAARSEYQDLAQQFSNGIDPRQRNQAKRLTDQFNGLKRKIDSRFRALPDKKVLQLKAAIMAKAEFLQSIENQLLTSVDDNAFNTTRNSIDANTWHSMNAITDKQYDDLLNQRLQSLQKAGSASALQKLADTNSTKLRALCVELEIRANVDTPKDDQGLRMQIQLEQLKQGFGKQKPTQKENHTFATEVELMSYCMGPLDSAIHQQLLERIAAAAKKL